MIGALYQVKKQLPLWYSRHGDDVRRSHDCKPDSLLLVIAVVWDESISEQWALVTCEGALGWIFVGSTETLVHGRTIGKAGRLEFIADVVN